MDVKGTKTDEGRGGERARRKKEKRARKVKITEEQGIRKDRGFL